MKKIDTRIKVLSFIGLVVALTILTVFASNKSLLFDLRQRATSSSGPGRIVISNPNGSTLNPNFPQTFTLAVTKLNSYIVDGIQVGVTISGAVPADLTFTPETIPGLSLVANSIRTEGTNRYLTLAYVTASPLQPFTIEPVSLKLGSFQASSVSGPLSFAPDNTLSKVLLHQSDTSDTIVDLLGQSTPNAFVLSTLAPTAVPTIAPSPTFAPTPVATVMPTSSPIPIPTLAPTAFPTPITTPRPATPMPTIGTTSATPPPTIICLNRVETNANGTLYWPNLCKGTPNMSICGQTIVALSPNEVSLYQQWVSMGRPVIPGCSALPTSVPTPIITATPLPTIQPTATPVSRPTIQNFIKKLLERYPWLRSRFEQQRSTEKLF